MSFGAPKANEVTRMGREITRTDYLLKGTFGIYTYFSVRLYSSRYYNLLSMHLSSYSTFLLS